MVDRYTKLVLTVIAICLVWIALGGPSLITPVEAQAGDRVILAGWIDQASLGLVLTTLSRARTPSHQRRRLGAPANSLSPSGICAT